MGIFQNGCHLENRRSSHCQHDALEIHNDSNLRGRLQIVANEGALESSKSAPEVCILMKDSNSTCSHRGGSGPSYSARKSRARSRSQSLKRQESREHEASNVGTDEDDERHQESRDGEVMLLPQDGQVWPFLLRFPLNTYGMCLGLGSQTILWKTMAESQELSFLHIPEQINISLWILTIFAIFVVSVTYVSKTVYYFEAVRREYFHSVRVNFFFAPWISGMFLALGLPSSFGKSVHPAVLCVLVAPILVLELKIYGQWLSGGKRRLSEVANSSTHLSVVGNFVGSLLAARVGWFEPAKFLWSVGLAHYLVLFVTLYQRLPSNQKLPKDLHPVMFLFVASPSAASLAWMEIHGYFDDVSRIVLFVALFMYTSLIVRINLFWGMKFSFAWWAYTFPMSAIATAAIEYCHAAPSWFSRILAIFLTSISSATVFACFCATILYTFVWKTSFQNDNAIATTAKGDGKRNDPLRGKEDMSKNQNTLTMEKETLAKATRKHLPHVKKPHIRG